MPPTAGCHSYHQQAGQPGPAIGSAGVGSAGSLPPPLEPVMPGRPVPAAVLLWIPPSMRRGAGNARLIRHNRFNLIRVILTDYTPEMDG